MVEGSRLLNGGLVGEEEDTVDAGGKSSGGGSIGETGLSVRLGTEEM